jgi:methionyl-tRNA synthetase
MKKDLIQYPDFQKLDIRIGEVKSAEHLEGSNKLLKLMVDLGPDYGEVQILSGIAKEYEPETLIGKKYPFIANLEPKPMMGTTSNGMICAADVEGKAVLIPVDSSIPNGTLIR